jgi:hypothetical protein
MALPPLADCLWTLAVIHYNYGAIFPIGGKLRFEKNRSRAFTPLFPREFNPAMYFNTRAHPPIRANSQVELTLYIEGRYKWGYVDPIDYAASLEVGLFLRWAPSYAPDGTPNWADVALGPAWTPISFADDGLARLFIGPGTPHPVPLPGQIWLPITIGEPYHPMVKMRVGGAAGKIIETPYTDKDSVEIEG